MKKHPLGTQPLKPRPPFNPEKYRTQADMKISVLESHKRLAKVVEHLPYFFALLDTQYPEEKSQNLNLKEMIRTYVSKRLESTQTPELGRSLQIGQECLSLREQIDLILPNFLDMITDLDITRLPDAVFDKAGTHAEFSVELVALKSKIITEEVMAAKKRA